jgi:RNA polymerase sigma-70 factor, ECF subfamily
MASGQVSAKRVERFLELLNAHDRSVYAYILMQVPNLADADQIAQDVRTRLWQQFDQYQEGTDFGAWSRTIAGYLVMAHYEKCSRDRLRFGEAFLASMQQHIESRIDGLSPRREALSECLKLLPRDQRKMLLDYYSGEESTQRLAEQIGKTYAALRQSVCRIRVILADCIDRRLSDASGIR